MWCVTQKKKVHLGFWIAHTCHVIATHPVRNLNVCHLLGAFVRNNLITELAPETSAPNMCKLPTLFDINFFMKTKLVHMWEGKPRFYREGQASIPSGKVDKVAGNKDAEDVEWKQKMEAVTARMIKENEHHIKLIDQQGRQTDNMIKMIEGLVRDIQETKELQAYQFDPESYQKLTGRERPAVLDVLEEDSPTTSKTEEEKEAGKEEGDKKVEETKSKKDERKKEKKSAKDQGSTPPDDSSRGLKKK